MEEKKTQFLTELKELLAKYDAEIYAGDETCVYIDACGESLRYSTYELIAISSKNVFDYDKD
jgi:IS1 family transposase